MDPDYNSVINHPQSIRIFLYLSKRIIKPGLNIFISFSNPVGDIGVDLKRSRKNQKKDSSLVTLIIFALLLPWNKRQNICF